MSLNRYTSLPARQTAQPRVKTATADENQVSIRTKSGTTTSRGGRLPLSNITNQAQNAVTGRENRPLRKASGTGQLKAKKAELECDLTEEQQTQEPKQTLKRTSSVLEQVLPAGRETIQTRSLTRSKRRRSDVPMEIEEVKQVEWIDIDEEDRNDPQMVSDYVNDIYEYCREKEVWERFRNLTFCQKQDMINPRYITKQLDINEKMRGVLVDWYSTSSPKSHWSLGL
jgi:hypothetical protein